MTSPTPPRPDPANGLMSPTLSAVVRAAVDATGADRGWLLAIDGDDLVVVAAAAAPGVAGPPPAQLLGRRRGRVGAAGYAASSGQPAALRPSANDAANDGAGGGEGVPASVLASPCTDDDVVGVLELVRSDGRFGFDEVEAVGWLADIAGAALVETGGDVPPPAPHDLAAALVSLSNADPRRYAEVARAVATLL